MKINRIASVSDVSIGFACPQIPDFQSYLMAKYGAKEGMLFEPDQAERPIQHKLFRDFQTVRVYTSKPPWNEQWMLEYNRICAEKINKFEPDVLVVYQPHTMPILGMLKKRPRFVVFYQLEMPEYYNYRDIYTHYHKNLKKYVDLMIFPEENRRVKYLQTYGDSGIPSAIIYNCPAVREPVETDAHRNGRVLYQGSIDRSLTFSDYYIAISSQSFPIDIFGMFAQENREELKREFSALYRNVRYLGYVSTDVLSKVRKRYSYGLVSWNPISDNYLFAAPNKFFEYIQDGVIPIAAPHPQCSAIIKKYHCGILMDNWDYDAFIRALRYAMDILGSSLYEEMQRNCAIACGRELNWSAQMKKIEQFLPKAI